MRILLLSFLLFALGLNETSWAFIPPVTAMVKEALDGRKTSGYELRWRYHVNASGGSAPTPVLIEERMVPERGRVLSVFQIAGQRPLAAIFDGKNYQFGGGKTIPSHSAVLVRYLTTTSPDELMNTLLAEGFLRQDQLRQYKQGFAPEGDPQTWAVRDNYVRHPDIFLERLHPGPGGIGPVAIAVVGVDQGAIRKTVDFDRKLRGIRRLEWREGADRYAWELDGLSAVSGLGHLPHHLIFQKGDVDLAAGELVRAAPLRGKAAADFQASFREASREASMTADAEAALKILLSYR